MKDKDNKHNLNTLFLNDEDETEDCEFPEEWLSEYTVDYPGEERLSATIAALRPHVPRKRTFVGAVASEPPQTAIKRLLILIRMAARDSSRMQSEFWWLNALFYAVGFLVWRMFETNPYWILLLLSPIPFLLGLMEVFRSRDRGLMELELSCKYSSHQLMMAKLVVTGGYNLILNAALLCAFGLFGVSLGLSKLFVYWITPFTIASCIGLTLSMKLRSSITAPAFLTVWTFAGMLFLSNTDFRIWAEELHPIWHGIIVLISAGIIARQINHLRRGDLLEIIDRAST